MAPLDFPHSGLQFLGSSPTLFLRFSIEFASEHQILSNLSMDFLRLKTYDIVVEIKWENFHERDLKRW